MIPTLFAGLIDDAALFPPGNAPMEQAVPAHLAHLGSPHAAIVGPFLCTDQRLPELQRELGQLEFADPLSLGLIVTGGAGAIDPALTWVRKDDKLSLAGLEIALRDEPDLGRNAHRIALACSSAGLEDDVVVSIEVPRGVAGMERALDAIAESGHRAKLRTGGVTADAFPSEDEVAEFILACLDREVPFKCTAGLHQAVRSTTDGFEQHGFLNVLVATRAALDGASASDVRELLGSRDAQQIVFSVRQKAEVHALSTRRWFTSYGSCSIDEPLADLTSLGLLEAGSNLEEGL